MADRPTAHVWTYRAAFAMIAVLLLFLRLLPLGSVPGQWPGPDILLGVVLAWVLRRPDYVPAPLIALVILVEDVLLMRPPGLWAAIVVVGTEFLRGRAALTRELSFAAEWLLVAAVMTGLLLLYRVAFAVAMLPQPGFGFAMVQTLGSIVCYPVVVFLSRAVLDVRKPAKGEVDAMGRRL